MHRNERLENVVDSQSGIVRRTLNRAMISAYMMGHFIEDRHGNINGFEHYADKLVQEVGIISSLQLAPNGVITHIHPIAENHEKALGYDLFANDQRREEAMVAINTGKLTVIGPLDLVQGGVGVLGRYPVFIGENEQRQFWGLTSALVMLDTFIAATDLPLLATQGFTYQLWHKNPHTQKREVFAGQLEGNLQGPVITKTITLPNKEWFLDVGYSNPSPHSGGYWFEIGLCLTLALLVSSLFYLLLKQPEKLRQRVIRQTQRLQELAFYDTLTNLPNRKLFADRLAQTLRRTQRDDKPFALLFLDIDGFKRINDTLGHEVGDKLLVEVAHRLKQRVRGSDTVARLGGDEFTLILNDIHPIKHKSLGDLVSLVQTLLEAINQPYRIDGQLIKTSVSIGVTLCPHDGRDSTSLLRNADLAMYKAKQQGKNTFHFFSEDLNIDASKRMQLEQEIHRALEEDHFLALSAHSQP